MPRGDGTGPQGRGPGTGRRMGHCGGGTTKRPSGQGQGQGSGLGRGQGRSLGRGAGQGRKGGLGRTGNDQQNQ